MANWKYDITPYGKALHSAINEAEDSFDGSKDVLNKLIACLEHIESIIPEDDFDTYFADIMEDAKLFVECEPDDYCTEQDEIENVDYVLSNFYDVCDGYRIWIGV